MRAQLLSSVGETSWALIFDVGDEVMSTLQQFAREQGLDAARFTAIGGFSSVTLGYFEVDQRRYRPIEVAEQVEVLSMIGDVAAGDDGPAVHAHVVVGRHDATTRGGHLLRALVRPTLEVVLVEAPAHLRRRQVPEVGAALIDLPSPEEQP